MTKNLTKEEILILIQVLRIISWDRGLNQKIIEAIGVSNKEMNLLFEKLKALARRKILK